MSFACYLSQKFRQYTAIFNGFRTSWCAVCVCDVCVCVASLLCACVLPNVEQYNKNFSFFQLARDSYKLITFHLSLSLSTSLTLSFIFSCCLALPALLSWQKEILAKNTFSSGYFHKNTLQNAHRINFDILFRAALACSLS